MAELGAAAPSFEAQFTREMGCTPQELQGWIPGASRDAPIQWAATSAVIALGGGMNLKLRWEVLPSRRIALLSLPRLAVHFDFGDASPALRQSFMHHFDLYTRRGGG